MLCRRCRRQVARSAAACGSCGLPVSADARAYAVVLGDRARIPVVGAVTIGRGATNRLRLDDAQASRAHARLIQEDGGLFVEDLGSRNGTFVDGRRVLRSPVIDGSRIRVGGSELVVERLRGPAEGGPTLIVRPGATVALVGTTTQQRNAPVPDVRARPRLRSGWALKPLGRDGFVLKDLRSGDFMRLDAEGAMLLRLLDGERTTEQLALDAERLCGADGPAHLIALLADLADRDMLHGAAPKRRRGGAFAALVRPRTWAWDGAGAALDRLYSRAAWILFTRPALVLAAIIAAVGAVAFAALLLSGGRTPFVVDGDVTLGAVAFLVGRFAVAAVHELAHGLTITSFGRRVSRAGGRLALVFPYVFIDTSDAWFEPRRRRIAIAAAGPIADAVVGGVCAIAAVLVAGPAGDAAFQIAFGAFVGILYTLNPLDERDGYHILADALRQPGLRSRARRRLRAVLAGRTSLRRGSRFLIAYGGAVAAWSLLTAALAMVSSERSRPDLAAEVSEPVAWLLSATLYACLLGPPLLALASPLAARIRGRR